MTDYVDPDKGNTEFLVRLLFRIPAKDPSEAVEKYLEQIMSYGLRNWSYRVEDEATGEMWHVDGFGQPIKDVDSSESEHEDDEDWDDLDDQAPSSPPLASASDTSNPDLQELLRVSRAPEG